MSKKSQGPNKPYGNAGGGATANAVKFGVGLRAGTRDTEVLIRLDDPGYAAASWTDAKLKEALELLAKKKEWGVEIERLAEAASHFGLRTRIGRLDVSDIAQLIARSEFPIVYLNLIHFDNRFDQRLIDFNRVD